MDKRTESDLDDLRHVSEQHYGSVAENTVEEAIWQQNIILCVVARQLARMNAHLDHIVDRLENGLPGAKG